MALGIAFEGCAVRATFQIGALTWFLDRGVGFGATGGSSSGSIVAASLAVDRVETLEAMWLELADTPVFRPRRVLRGRWPYAMSHILGDALSNGFGARRMCDAQMPLVITLSQLRRRGVTSRLLTHFDTIPIARAVRASCFIPGPYSRMVPIGRRLTFDGAWKVRTPVQAVGDLGADRVIAVVSNPEGRLRRGGLRSQGPLARPTVDHRILAPLRPLPLAGFDFDRPRVIEAMAIGRDSAAAFARAHESWL
ncbi:MAG: patatin-like phospholipase family protein [Proteobacteria bacterium]|nr:patatin-like phospholipase family protein [Pseudomonadota bacterium]